jgi:aspartyl-tRNA(Asn)/glutamyl-tRNA(Gln) amidotransferase subunit C
MPLSPGRQFVFRGVEVRLSPEEVRHIAHLIRLGLDEADVEKFSVQLSNILENFEILQEVDTTDVPPTSHSIAVDSVFRDDEVAPSLAPGEILANAPREEDGCFRVRAVLE